MSPNQLCSPAPAPARSSAERPHGKSARPTYDVLRCVCSDYLGEGGRCVETVPCVRARAAWKRELSRGPALGERFFRFAWDEGEWLAYGLQDGSVRGVYCPAHSTARDERAFADIAGSQPAQPPAHA